MQKMMPARNLMFALFSFVLLVFCSQASAQSDPSQDTSSFWRGITPENPIAGQPFVLNIFSGECEFLTEARTGAFIQSIVGNTVNIYVDGVPNLACSWTTGERQYDLPGIPNEGQYQLRVFFVPSGPGQESESIGTRNVTVVAAPGQFTSSPVVVPTMNSIGLLLLILSAVASATWWHRRS